jgi:hypothetical protein
MRYENMEKVYVCVYREIAAVFCVDAGWISLASKRKESRRFSPFETLENERDGKCNFIYVGMIHINKIKV